MTERTGLVTLHGNAVTLVGTEANVGDAAPDVVLAGNDLSPVALSSYRGRVCILVSVPSLDTPVCDTETRRFNEEAAALGDGVVVVTVSVDLPFAQARWCGATGVDRVTTLSDYREAAFGKAYGVLMGDVQLLARAVFVVDRDGTIRYTELVREVADEPDYSAAFDAARSLL